MRRLLAFGLVATMAACAEQSSDPTAIDDSTDTGSGAPSTQPSGQPGGQTAPHTVTGIVLDTKGQPMPNALVWIEPALTTGLVTAHTGADGRYTASSLINVPYYAKAWTTVAYGAQSYCLRLGMPNAGDFDSFVPTQGAVRNFRWQLTGPIPGLEITGATFGGEIRLIGDGSARQTDSVEVKLVPNGPLIDGSTGQTIVRRVGASDLFNDVPIGRYTATVSLLGPNGSGTPLKVGANSSASATSMAIGFSPSGCGNDSGVSRAYIFWGK